MGLLAINLEMMRTLKTFVLIFFLTCILVLSEAKLTKKQKKIIKKFKKVRKQAYDYEELMTSLNSTLEDVEKLASVSNRHRFGEDALTVVDATMSATICGPSTLTTWSITQNWYSADKASTDSADPFNGGTFTSQINGWYHICSFSRFRGTGNSNDVTVLVSGGVVAAYGNADTSDWRTTGVCFDAYLLTTQTVQVRQQSGGSNDCIQSTAWPYNKFTVHNTGNNA